MCSAIGSILLGFLILVSLVALVLWIPLTESAGQTHFLTALWGACLALLALEICYFRSLRAARRAAGIEWLT